jgi:hypothetical protein
MGFIVLFRRDRTQSPFREFLHRLIALPQASGLFLSTGFVWDHPSPRGYSVSGDALLAEFQKRPALSVTTVCGMFYRTNQWGNNYLQFYSTFVSRLRAGGVNVSAYAATRGRWHAKVAVAVSGAQPLAAIVGSSNLTRPAYGVNWANYNNEADVVLWADPAIGTFFLQRLDELRQDGELDAGDFIVGESSQDYPQPSDQERLTSLWEAVSDSNLLQPWREGEGDAE